jgi:molecular chaperone GrpE
MTIAQDPDPQDVQNPPAEPADGAAPAAAAPPGAADLEKLQRERDDYYDRLLRKTAEFDNYRRRTERQRSELAQQVAGDVIEALLPIVDDFERALQAAAGPEAETYKKGVELIYRQLQDMLARRGVKPVETVGQPFDPRFHQAITYESSPGRAEGEVVEEVRRGYTLGDRLLRPAMVKVARA